MGSTAVHGDDRWCAIAVFTDEEWRSFCKAAGHAEWIADPRFSTLGQRKANEAELNRLVEAWTQGLPAEQVMTVLQAAGVAAGVVQNARDIYEDPQLRHREFFWRMKHTEMGDFTHLGEPARLSKTPATPEGPGALPWRTHGDDLQGVARHERRGIRQLHDQRRLRILGRKAGIAGCGRARPSTPLPARCDGWR